ncbi:MAG: class I SAM-dependent RNA methyltransferase [Candidatus Omnitrophota bacterium]
MDEIVSETIGYVKPLCPVFDECGGCAYQNISYSDELKIKQQRVTHTLHDLLAINPAVIQPIVPSPKEYHYRHRLDLRLLKTKEQKIFIGFSPKDRFGVVDVNQCAIAMESVSDFIPRLKEEVAKMLPAKYRLANLVVRCGQDGRLQWGGVGKGSLNLKEENYLWVEIEGRKVFYSLDTFFQANLSILPVLFRRIRQLDLWSDDTVFYDLYGGVGLFTLGLLGSYSKSYLIEDCKNSINLANYNVQYHRLDHVHVVEGRVEDHLDGLLANEPGQAVAMIDPPRAGLTPAACELISGQEKFGSIFYLSCNPEALARDLKYFLRKGWAIQTVIPFDFFPKTKHIETFVWLKQLKEQG